MDQQVEHKTNDLSFPLAKERVREFLQKLPPQGIAIHATNLSRAQSIVENGFLPDDLKPKDEHSHAFKGTWFYHMKPLADEADIRLTLKSFEDALETLNGYARKTDEGNKSGALVVLVPPTEPWFTYGGSTKGVAYPAALTLPPSKEQILGMVAIDVPLIKNTLSFDNPMPGYRRSAISMMKKIGSLIANNQEKIDNLSNNSPS